jgi:transcriptional regulator with XRE-family HTH domain
LQALRLGAGLTGEQAGRRVERSGSWISRLEAGRIGVRLRDLRDLLDLYELTDAQRRGELEELAQEGQHRAWWSSYYDVVPESYGVYIGLETGAKLISTYENLLVPGLLQTRDYARAVIEQTVPFIRSDAIGKLLEVRMGRQERFFAGGSNGRIAIVMDEAILHRPIGPPGVFQAQIESLLRPADDRTTVRVLPFSRAGQTVLATAFTIMDFELDPGVVYVETATGGVYESNIQLYHQIFDKLFTTALDTEGSVAALRQALKRET